ncbi:VWA domain-containing protein [Thermohalobacter berrensis]|uniref:VWFA domain-containing protein n=1 Tax=Thermohalobacter berrensis TaxID=99594 RepID=A0A419SZ61_9FIRM|nr:VWA domain-containing protein [Thermohalobacter berrensis]RKD30553.1 hypothetical protein BET03_04235 [Thermohalobacter berrensis]
MDISLKNPFLLFLIPLSTIFIFYTSNNLNRMSKAKKRAILGIRTLIFILLILSISGLTLKSYVDTVTTIFAVDLSESTTKNHNDFINFINDSLEYTTKKDRVGIVTFGEEGEVENTLTDRLDLTEFQTNPGNNFTNIEDGLRLSRLLIPNGTKKRIVLFTDGEENIGNSIKEGSLIKYNDIDFKIYRVDSELKSEVQIKKIEVPDKLYENQKFDINVHIWSNVKTRGKLTLYSDRVKIGEEEVVIEKGENRFVFKDKATSSGLKSYRALITPEDDTKTVNNSYSTFSEVKGRPRILLVDDTSNGGREINKILKQSNIGVDYIKAREAPHSLSELLKYKSIVMCDVSLENLNNDFINALKIYVRDYGRGLFVTGGENSYALGGYYKTPLEEILPVNMEMKIDGKVPNLALMLIIDKSGSMGSEQYGVSKIELAKEAAIKALDSLKIKDKIGVIAFDDSTERVVKLRNTDDREKIKELIGTLRAEGGTSIIPALEEAYNSLKDADTKLKHIILLTDGQAEKHGYEKLINDMKKVGITISTVAVGQGADTYLLEDLANKGKGRYYYVDEASNIPKIFTKEAFLASKAYINNRTFTPLIGQYHEVLDVFSKGLLNLDGYIGTSPKGRAEVILWSDKEDPILAIWQYGLGKSAAWMSDMNGKWTMEYLNSNEGIEFFKRIVEWTFSNLENNKGLSITSNLEGNKVKISAKDRNNFNQEYETKALIITPNLEKRQINLDLSKPGEYYGEITIDKKGVYLIKVNQSKEGKRVKTANHAIAVNYSKEYDYSTSRNILKQLSVTSGGKFITDPKEVFKGNLKEVYGIKDLSRAFLIIVLVLFILDIAIRRLNISIRFNPLDNRKKDESKKTKNISKKKVESKKELNKTEGQREKQKLDTSRLIKAKNKRKR